MSAILDFTRRAASRQRPTLVLIDLQEQYWSGSHAWNDDGALSALTNCRRLLDHARSLRGPVAFVRRTPEIAPWSARWINGFMPERNDMVFERHHPSCFGSSQFTEMMAQTGGTCALAGLFGESALLATAIDAFHFGHRVTFLADASASRAAGELTSPEVHRAVTAIVGLYGAVDDTSSWIDASRTLHIGGNCNG